MISENERTQFVWKLFLAILFVVLMTIYNSACIDKLISFDTKQLKIVANNNKKPKVQISKPLLNETRTIIVNPIPKGYLVWSENCHMPSMDPFAPHYRRKYKEQLRMHYDVGPTCNETAYRLIFKTFNQTIKSYMLHINVSSMNEYGNLSTVDDIDCCYRKIIRKGDKNYKLLNCIHFQQDFIVPNHIDYMTVQCSRSSNKSAVFYKDGMFFIQERSNVNEKIRNNSQTGRRFGILLFGIDTVSQFNFRRVMPKTFEYVLNNSWFELSGYNKVNEQLK